MSGAASAARVAAMRALALSSLIAAAVAAVPATAQDAPIVPVAAEEARPPAPLAPLAADSPWLPRFAAAADALAEALRSGNESRWAPLLGGQWLAPADRARVAALLNGRDSPFRHALFSKGFTHRAILGWQPPATLTAEDRADIAASEQAEALVCWSSGGDGEVAWPRTAAEADNAPGRRYACARIAYSLRGGAETWRAFIEGP